MAKFVVLTLTGGRGDGDEVYSSVYEADDFASLLDELMENHGECMEEPHEEYEGFWSVFDDDQMHYITQVD